MATEEKENTFISRDRMIADPEYVAWISELKSRYRTSQAKAAIQVNSAMLEFNWSLGHDIIEKQVESKWGSGFFNQLSLDLRHSFPQTTGFSVTNLKYMKRWYAFYNEKLAIRQQPVDELHLPQMFGKIPWSHHIKIITKCKSYDEALFYIYKTIEENWSRDMLDDQLRSALYQKTGKVISNFNRQLPVPQGQLAQEILKDPYNFDFLTLRKGYDEHELEDALVHNITRFLLELGRGFAFVGRQMELKMEGGKSFFPDLVFYHIKLKAYVVIELKVVEFIPEFAGKLNFYVTAADKLLRDEGDNPSIGLLICKSSDKTIVEWSLNGIDKPLGVANYELQEVVVRTLEELETKDN